MDTAAGADGFAYSILVHAGHAGETAIVTLINASWLMGHLQSPWKTTDIQPISLDLEKAFELANTHTILTTWVRRIFLTVFVFAIGVLYSFKYF